MKWEQYVPSFYHTKVYGMIDLVLQKRNVNITIANYFSCDDKDKLTIHLDLFSISCGYFFASLAENLALTPL